MKSFIVVARLALLLATADAVTAQCRTDDPRPDRGGKIEWRQDTDQAFADAARTGEPIVIYFTADW